MSGAQSKTPEQARREYAEIFSVPLASLFDEDAAYLARMVDAVREQEEEFRALGFVTDADVAAGLASE